MKIRLGIGKKLLIPIMVVFLVFSIILSLVMKKMLNEKFILQGANEAEAVVSLISENMDAEKVELIKDIGKQEEAYQDMYEYCNLMIERTGAKYIYIVGDFEGTYQYFFSNNEETSFIEPLEDIYISEMEPVFAGEKYVTPYIDDSGYGKLISAYVPIYDTEGNVTAVLGVDYDAEFVAENIQSIVKVLYLSIAAIVISIFICVFCIIQRMVKQLLLVDNKLDELISSNGDLTKTIDIKSDDEIGDIGKKINSLLGYILDVIKNISSVSDKMKQSIQETRTSVHDSANELSDVSAATQEINAMIEESYSNIENITSVIDSMRELLDSVYVSIGDGKKMTESIKEKAVTVCEDAKKDGVEVRQTSEQLAASVQEKIGQANEVEKINVLTAKILDVANKTSMLALNASIEAARAGEAGRGFSVVAEEISKLSDDTTKTAKEIQQISNMIVNVVEALSTEAENIMNYVSDKTAAGYERLCEVGEDYVESSEQVTKFFESMNGQSMEIESGMEDIVDAIQMIHNAVKECALGICQVAQNTSTLNENMHSNLHQVEGNEEMMESLKSEVSKFII